MGQESLTDGQEDERLDGGMFSDASAAIRPDGTSAAARAGELLTQHSSLQAMLDSFDTCRTDASLFKKWVEDFDTLISNPPPRYAPLYDSRLDPNDFYGKYFAYVWGVAYERSKNSLEVTNGITNPVAYNSIQKSIIEPFSTMPRSKRDRTGGAGREGEVVLYYDAEGQTVSAVKYYQERYNAALSLQKHNLPNDLPSSKHKHPAEAAQDIAEQYKRKMEALFPDQPSRDQEALHPWIRELRLRMRLHQQFPHSPEVLAKITDLGFTMFVNHMQTTGQFNDTMDEQALVQALAAIDVQAQVSYVMEVIVPNAKFSDLTATQMQSAISQWATFLHEMAEIGMINTDKPHAEVVLDGQQVRVRTYDMGAVSVISPDRKLEVIRTMHPGLHASASALLSAIDGLENSLKQKVQAMTTDQGLVSEVLKLLQLINDNQISNPTILTSVATISKSITSAEVHNADQERSVIAKSCENIRNEIRKYLDYVLITRERGSSQSASLAQFIEAFNLPDILSTTDRTKAVREFEAIFLIRDAGAVIPLLEVLEACLIRGEDRYASLIDIFFQASETMTIKGVDLSHDPETLRRWDTIRQAITGESAQYNPHDTSREQDTPPSGGGILVTQVGSREDRPGITDTEIMSVQQSVQDLVAAMEAKLGTAQRQLDEISEGQVRRIAELEGQLTASATEKSHLLLMLGELSASTRQYIENIQKHIKTLEESIASLESGRAVSLEESSLKDKRILALEQELVTLREEMARLQTRLSAASTGSSRESIVGVASAPEAQENLSGESYATELLRAGDTIKKVVDTLAKEKGFGDSQALKMVLTALETMGESEIVGIIKEYLEALDLQGKYSDIREKIRYKAGSPTELADYVSIVNGYLRYDKSYKPISISDLDNRVTNLRNRLKDWTPPTRQT